MSDRQHHIIGRGQVAHCGDAEVMAGGIVAKYTRNGHKAFIVHLTAGEKGHRTLPPKSTPSKSAGRPRPPPRVWAPTPSLPYKRRGAARQRRGDLRAGRPDPPGEAHDHPHPLEKSIHKDHTNTSLIAEDARFYAAAAGHGEGTPAGTAPGDFSTAKTRRTLTDMTPTSTSTSAKCLTCMSRRCRRQAVPGSVRVSLHRLLQGAGRDAGCLPTASTPRR